MKAFGKMFRELPLNKKIQFVAASILSLTLMAAIPVAAWFVSQRRIIKLQKIQAPNVLVISAAQREDKMYFEIDGVNPEENQLFYKSIDRENGTAELTSKLKAGYLDEYEKINHKDYVFCVSGDSVSTFMIQLAHTTNNPFTYQIFAADEYASFGDLLEAHDEIAADQAVDYITYTVAGKPANLSGIREKLTNVVSYEEDEILYYTIDTDCADTISGEYKGVYLNAVQEEEGQGEGEQEGQAETTLPKAAKDGYYNNTYAKTNNAYEYVQQDAIPLYWQKTGLQAIPGDANANKLAFSRHFILRVSWAEDALKNAEKETDIVYLSIKATS